MTKKLPVLVLAIGIVLALVISIASYGILKKNAQSHLQSQETTNVVIAAMDLPWGTKLTAAALKTAPYLKKSLPRGYHASTQNLEGRVLVFPVKTNEPIFESSLAPESVKSGGMAAVVQPTKRAMAVKVDKVVGVSGFIFPGNRVDVLVTLKDRTDQRNAMTKIVLDNVLVLAAGPEVEKTGKQEKPSSVDVITLEVSPEEGEKLALAATEGKLQLALRNFGDTEKVATKGMTIPALLAGPAGNATKPLPRIRMSNVQTKTFRVELIQGNKVSNVTFNGGNY